MTGVGIYVPHGGSGGNGGETLICVDARPLVDPLRPLDVATELDSEYGNEEETELSIFSRVSSEKYHFPHDLKYYFQKPFVIMANEWWEVALNVSSIKKKYGMGPSGLWSPSGSNGLATVKSHSVNLEFKETVR